MLTRRERERERERRRMDLEWLDEEEVALQG
jgi:hypothetical protein